MKAKSALMLAAVVAVGSGCGANPDRKHHEMPLKVTTHKATETERANWRAAGRPIPVVIASPGYPEALERAGVTGCVTIGYDAMPDGLPDNFEVLASLPRGVFDKVGLKALSEYRFEPRPAVLRSEQTFYFEIGGRFPSNDDPTCSQRAEWEGANSK